MPDFRALDRARISAWVRDWGPLLPILIAVFIVMLGFGAMIPVLPLFVTEQGIDTATLGVIVAGWAIGRLLFEPFFGWWADRHSRKPQMVAALAIVGVSSALMLVFTSAPGLFLLRFAAGVASGMFGPAARGSLVEATDRGSRGQAFGYFAAFQMGGFVLGPAIGALGSSVFGGYAFPFVALGVLGLVSAWVLGRYLPVTPHVMRPTPSGSVGEKPKVLALAEAPATAAPTPHPVPEDDAGPPAQAPQSALLKEGLPRCGDHGRRRPADLRHRRRRVVALPHRPRRHHRVFAMVVAGSPHGRASLAQGIYASAGTAAVIVASLAAGALREMDSAYPCLFYAAGVATSFVLGVVLYTGLFGRWPRRATRAAEGAQV